MQRHVIDGYSQRFHDESDVNVGQVMSWKFIASAESSPNVLAHYGDGGWVLDTSQHRVSLDRMHRMTRELKRVNGIDTRPTGEVRSRRGRPRLGRS